MHCTTSESNHRKITRYKNSCKNAVFITTSVLISGYSNTYILM